MRAGLSIRAFRAKDAHLLGPLFLRSVREVGRARYTQAQVEAWAPAAPDARSYLRRAGDGRLLLVGVDGHDRPLAYGDLERHGHIDHLYAAPEATGTGLADALCEALEQAAADWGLARVHVETSELARSLLLKRGYRTLGRQDLVLRGVPIHNWRMDKRLAP